METRHTLFAICGIVWRSYLDTIGEEKRMVIVNGNVFGENGRFQKGNIRILGDVIVDIDYSISQNAEVTDYSEMLLDVKVADCSEMLPDVEAPDDSEVLIDAGGLYVIPGLVDIHLHGCAGYDFCEGTQEAFDAMAEYEVKHGVTSIVPATMTIGEAELMAIMESVGNYVLKRPATKDSVIKGITMEGPFISKGKKGAQNEQYIREVNVELFRKLQKASGGMIKQVAVAPELNGAKAFIKELGSETIVSVAHTEADYEQVREAFACGANHVTHLYNAMLPFIHREPGVIGAAFDNKDVFVELICDGEHVHPAVVRATFQMFGAHRICMISDSMSATGMANGEYSLGGQKVYVEGRRAVLEDGNLAASVSNLYGCMKRAVQEMGIPLEEAILACTATPAKSLGLEQECGFIRVGGIADLLLLDEDLGIRCVMKAGKKIKG